MSKDKKYIAYLLGSLDYIKEWTQTLNLTLFKQDIKTNDAVKHRLNCIGHVASLISEDVKRNTPKIPWSLLIVHKYSDEPDDIIWEIINGDDIGSINHIYMLLEEYCLTEFSNHIVKSSIKDTDSKISRDFKYPITTRNSIYTVKKK